MFKKLWHNGPLWNAIGSLMYGINSFLLLMLVSRYAGVEAAGNFGIAFTTAQLLYLVGLFGASNYQMTDFREDHAFQTYGRLKLFSSSVMLLSGVAVCIVLGYDAEKQVLTLLLTVYMLAHSVSELWQNRMFQRNRLDLSGKSLCFRTLLSLVIFALCLVIRGDLRVSCFVLALTNLVAVGLFAWLPCKQTIPASRKAQGGELLGLIRACAPLFASMLMINILVQLPKYTVEANCSPYTLGIFNMIFMPVQVINLISSFLFRPMLKTMADQVAEKNSGKLLQLLTRQFVLIGGFIVACLLGGWLLGTQVLGLLYGADLASYRAELLLIILGGGIFAFCQVLYYTVLLFRKQRLIFCNYGSCTVLCLVFCPFLTGKFGMLGAIGGFIIAHIILLLGYCIILTNQLRRLRNG